MSVHQSVLPPRAGPSKTVDVLDIMDTIAALATRPHRRSNAFLQPSSANASSAPAPRSLVKASVRPPSSSTASSSSPWSSPSSSSPSTGSGASCFSRSEKATTTATTAESGGATASTANQVSTENDDHPTPLEPTLQIPCEYVDFNGCEERFAVDDVEGWVAHLAEVHLGHNYPPRCICWWCDGPHAEFFTDSERQSERQANFHARMEHIAEHYQYPGYAIQPRRPDFHLMEFLLQEKLVGQSLRERLIELSELKRPTYWEEVVSPASPASPHETVEPLMVLTTSARGKIREQMYHN